VHHRAEVDAADVTLASCALARAIVSSAFVATILSLPTSTLGRKVASGMNWTRHQLTPAMPGEKIVDGAVAGWCPIACS
jgi:hypothetical protein